MGWNAAVVTVAPAEWLTGKHTIFGEVTDGYEVVEAISTVPTGAMDRPTDWPEIIAFAHATGRVRETWELEALADMCRAYHRELTSGADPFRIAPIDRRP